MKNNYFCTLVISVCMIGEARAQPCEIVLKKDANTFADELNKKAVMNMQDCKEGMTAKDKVLIADTVKKVQALKDTGIQNAEFEKGVGDIVSGVFDSLSPAAKAALTQEVFKESLASPESKEYRRSLNEFLSAAEAHSKSFGPGGIYANFGRRDIIKGKVLEIHKESWTLVNDKYIALAKSIHRLDIPEEEQDKFLNKLSFYKQILDQKDRNVFEGTQERLEAEKGDILIGGAVVALALLTVGMSKFFSRKAGVAASTSATYLATATGVSATVLVVGHANMIGEAYLSNGDFGCEYAMRAFERNPELTKSALVSGLAAMALGPAAAKLAPYKAVMKVVQYTSSTLIGGSAALDGKEAWDRHVHRNLLLKQSDEAFAAGDFNKAAALEKDANNEGELVHKFAMSSGTKVTELLSLLALARKHSIDVARRKHEFVKTQDENISKFSDLELKRNKIKDDYYPHIDENRQIKKELDAIKASARQLGFDFKSSELAEMTTQINDSIRASLLGVQK